MKKLIILTITFFCISIINAKENQFIKRVCFTVSCCSVGPVGVQVFSMIVCYEVETEGANPFPKNITYFLKLDEESNLRPENFENEFASLNNNHLRLLSDWELTNAEVFKDFNKQLVLPKGDYLINENHEIIVQ